MCHKKKKSWQFPIDKSFKKLIKKKHKCLTRFQKTKDKNVLTEYKSIRNLVRKESRTITKKFQTDVAKSCKSNPKKFWQHVRSKTTSSSGIGDIKVFDSGSSRTITSDSEKTSDFF